MPRPSSIDKLPQEIKAQIATLRNAGHTIDEILEHLQSMDVEVKRSPLGRHVKRIDEIAEKVRAQREVATAISKDISGKGHGELARGNIELLQSLIMQAATKSEDFDPKELMFFAKAVVDLTKGAKVDIDAQLVIAKEQARREALSDAAEVATKEARKQGLSADTINAIKSQILGVKA